MVEDLATTEDVYHIKDENIFYNRYSADRIVNIFLLVITCITCIVGVVGNTLVIGAVLTYKPLRRLGNAFIVNLAIADLCVSAFVNYFGIIGVLTHGEYFHERIVLCELIGVVCITSCSCSVWTVAAISVNRYVAICHRIYYPRLFNRYTMMVIIPSLWGACFLIDLPNLLGWGRHSFDAKATLCTYDYTYSYSYTVFFVGIGFILPLSVLVISYAKIFAYARTVMKEMNDMMTQQNGQTRQAIRSTDKKLLKTVLIVVVAFFTVWAPYTVISFFDPRGTWPRPVYVVAILCMHSSSCINSILYATTNEVFRKGYVNFLKVTCCLMCCKLKGDISDSEFSNTVTEFNRHHGTSQQMKIKVAVVQLSSAQSHSQ